MEDQKSYLGRVLFVVHDLLQDDVHYPAWAGYLASSLQQAGAECEVYDMAVNHYTNEQLAAHLDKNEYDLICLSFLCARYVETIKPLLSVIAEHKERAHLNIGGHCASAIPVYFMNTSPIDSVCVGESEATIVDLLECVINGTGLHSVDGIAYRWDKRIVETDRRKPPNNLDNLPFPAYELFDMDAYSKSLHLWGQDKGDRCIGFTTSRGCVGHCKFCQRLEHGVRFRGAVNVVNEMEFLFNEYNINGYFLYDEMFVASKDRLRRIKQELDDRGMQIKFSANARVDGLTRVKMVLLKDLGCTFLNLGVESTSQRVLDLMSKGTTTEQNTKAVELTKEFGITPGINMLWNNPGDDVDTLQKNTDFIIIHTDHDQLRTIRPVCPYPGSPLYYEAIDRGLLKGPAEFFDLFKNSDLITVNFMNIPLDKCYQELFTANSKLILDYQLHTDMSMDEANKLIEGFHDLYFCGKTVFRGARHYEVE